MGLLKVSSAMNPDALSCLSQYSEEDRRLVLICSGAVVAVAFVFYIILCTGRLDCSE
ncbi:MAG: hypothetical protein LUG56_05330 [Lachnospiraceae bacterium]|nr:hypothetical protein [Lachnospiraceae bacterium]